MIGLEDGTLTKAAKFTGKDLDEDTGLYYFNARWYDQEVGRFISRDPLKDQNNPNFLFTCARNNPLIFVDLTGLETFSFNIETISQPEWDNDEISFGDKGDDVLLLQSILAQFGYLDLGLDENGNS